VTSRGTAGLALATAMRSGSNAGRGDSITGDRMASHHAPQDRPAGIRARQVLSPLQDAVLDRIARRD
jgi:hypothetical protein